MAQGIVTKKDKYLIYEGTSGYGSPPNLGYIKNSLTQKAEARVGFFLLTLGYLLQSFDYFGLCSQTQYILSTRDVLSLVILLMVIIAVSARLIQYRLFLFYGKKMAAIVVEEDRNDSSWIIMVAEFLLPKIHRTPNENDNRFVSRILKELKLSDKVV